MQLLCAAETARDSMKRLQDLPGRQIEARVSEGELRGIVVADGVTALVSAPDQVTGGQSVVIDDPAAVGTLQLLFVGAWSGGRPLPGRPRLSPRLRTELVQNILRRLRDGHTDEAAAREINVSLRTYRRYVAEIMRELDANSRFQAGVRAVEYGLLPA
ncbi:hypothetical protein AB0N16_38365 [Streptomyces sp. NPDC051105]|uniref:helix-turn-helix transcriptional regulator n=1 Tax=Streptomyces sp. NPDC051105 TaxID=3154843 RepID=UPI003419C15C